MAFFEKIKDWLMPPEDEEFQEEEVEKKEHKQEEFKSVRHEAKAQVAVNDTAPTYSARNRFDSGRPNVNFAPQQVAERPKFKLHTSNTPSLNMEVHVPQSFDQVRVIGDQLKKKNAVIVNYEMLGVHDQRRICDFLNGLTYVLDGDVKRISNHIVLYVPDGVDVSDAMLAVA